VTIYIEALSFETIIGILPFEREAPQRLIIDITIEYTYATDCFINYAEVAQAVMEHVQKEQFLLLEEALGSLKCLLKHRYKAMKSLTIKLTKPDILNDCQVAVSENWKFDNL
jgi:dihydroneopterin aldolase